MKCLHNSRKVKRKRIKAPARDSSSSEDGQVESSQRVRNYSSPQYFLFVHLSPLQGIPSLENRASQWVVDFSMLCTRNHLFSSKCFSQYRDPEFLYLVAVRYNLKILHFCNVCNVLHENQFIAKFISMITTCFNAKFSNGLLKWFTNYHCWTERLV